MFLARVAPVLLCLALPACTLFFDDDPEPCVLEPGTPVAAVYSDYTGTLYDVTDGVEVPLIPAPQGGFILTIGAKLQLPNESRCQLTINAALRDPATNRVLGLEERPMTVSSQRDGWAWPPNPAGLSDLANVAVCPASIASTAIFGNPYRLEVNILEGTTGGSGPSDAVLQTAATITPICNSDYCRSDCGPPPP